MQRRSLILSAPFLILAARGARAATQVLDRAGSMAQLRAIAVWQGGAEVTARGYGGFAPDRPTNIKSASKSVISALAGIAIAKGLFSGPDQKVAEVLARDLPSDPDPRMDELTLGHLLSMQAGLQRQSGPNYGRWVSSSNWVRAALAAPFETDPGGRMLYSTASSHLVSAMLTKVGGKSALALARDWLKIPGFAITAWEQDPQGIYLGGNQMAMSTRSLLAFGAAYALGGRGVIPPEWISASWQPRTRSIFNGEQYGYGWFISRIAGREVRYGWGYGGQMIYVFPGDEPVAIAMTSDPDQPSARTGYRQELHGLAGELVQSL
ncbi:serine hydrolase domain-containing protein [Paracoccus ravus]|uniref:serine hydrolase domain-containing protein n=1 Tax=Paracoccus ravus TaxID=2447760 RepID=UPI00106EABE5|nr:serine hydrolase [Paracoccus ravus]